jgi:hypothetical protein
VLERLASAKNALRARTTRNIDLETELGVLKLESIDKLDDLMDKHLAEISQGQKREMDLRTNNEVLTKEIEKYKVMESETRYQDHLNGV